LKILKLSDWYGVQRKDVNNAGGRRLFFYFHSLGELLESVYPEYPWVLSRFKENAKVPRGHWQISSNIALALEAAEKRLGITRVMFNSILN